jgi:uncharacterized membrane protein YfcA
MELLILNLIIISLIVCFGSVLQASTGFGVGLIIVPLLALVDLSYVPGPVIFGSLALSSLMTLAGRHHIDSDNLPWISIGLIIGSVIGAQALSYIPHNLSGVLFGSLIIIAIALSYLKFSMRLNIPIYIAAGVASGFMGTTSAIGAPVLALLYQYHEGKRLRATLGFLYFLSSIMMIILLHFHGHFGLTEIKHGLLLMPGFVLGFFIAQPIARYLDKGYTRPAVLVIAFASAFYLMVKSMAQYAG